VQTPDKLIRKVKSRI